ncbi:MAG: hypothetical protein Q9191_007866 [Dirinaria sp. TL-2023a]
MPVPRARILSLMEKQCLLFSTTFNPTQARTGNKVLRQRLKGPSVAAYYPRRLLTVKDVKAAYPGLKTWDPEELSRMEHVARMKLKGKGPPKKKRTKEESKKFFKGRKKTA